MLLRLIGPVLIVFCCLLAGPHPAQAGSLREEAYRNLDAARDDKRLQLTSYLERTGELARTVSRDTVMQRYFTIKQRYWQLQRQAPAPAEVRRSIDRLKQSIRDHYLRYYMGFYDILFVDSSGFVLSSIRHQGEYHRNLFEGDLARTALARHLQDEPGESFVDYEFYWVSDEPSAFFVEPLVVAGQHLGWFVCQCAINKVNAIFSRDAGLGRTGETFLVNRQHQMLTESRLYPGGGGGPRRLARENIEPKFDQGEGHRRVTDYRGYAALTSFTACRVMGSEWLVVAKMDEDEVITNNFRDRQRELAPQLADRLAGSRPADCMAQALPLDAVMVDMDEYRVSDDSPLITFGVATCTAILISLPGGVTYLGHASERDAIYGGQDMDLLGNMLRHIQRFEIYPYQLRDVRVMLAAPHRRSLTRAVDKLLEAGLLLSQIRFLHDSQAGSATLVHYPERGRTVVRWQGNGGREPLWQCAEEAPNLGEILEQVIGYR